MCGIFGAVSINGTLTLKQQAFIETATEAGQIRGRDGTGWALYNVGKGLTIYKKAVCGSDFLETFQGRKAIKKLSQCSAVIGHNRKTTSGGDKDLDCHPFQYDTITGVHNGGIPDSVMNRLDVTEYTSNVDSSKILSAINDADNPIDVLSKIHTGSYVLVWINATTQELCIARNKERPLWAASGDDGLYFASEPGMLFWLMSRFSLQAKDSKLYELTPMHLYRIPLLDAKNVRREEYKISYPEPAKSYYTYDYNTERGYKGYDYAYNTSVIHQYAVSTAALRTTYPALSYIADIIDANCNLIVKEPKKSNNTSNHANHLDVVVTNVVENSKSSSYPDIFGYVYDATDSDEIIPVQLLGIKDDGYGIKARYEAALKISALVTIRGAIRNIKICADGTVILIMGMINIWSDESNEKLDDDAQIGCLVVQDSQEDKYKRFTHIQLADMWKKLRQSILQNSKTVH